MAGIWICLHITFIQGIEQLIYCFYSFFLSSVNNLDTLDNCFQHKMAAIVGPTEPFPVSEESWLDKTKFAPSFIINLRSILAIVKPSKC